MSFPALGQRQPRVSWWPRGRKDERPSGFLLNVARNATDGRVEPS